MAENHRIAVIKGKTAQFHHTGHTAVTHVHASVLWKIVRFLWEIDLFLGFDMAKCHI